MTAPTLPPGFVLGDGSTAAASARAGWRRYGWAIGLAAASLVVLAFLALTKAPTSTQPLSISNAQPEGTRAVAEILRNQGVEVTEVATLSGAAAALESQGTLVIASYPYFDEDQLASIAAWNGPTIWLAPNEYDLTSIDERLVYSANAGEGKVTANCSLPAAQAADTIVAPGHRVDLTRPSALATTCFGTDSSGSVFTQFDGDGGGSTTVIAATSFLTNEFLADEGNAALALHLLGSRGHVAWYMGTFYDTSTLDGTGAATGVTTAAPAWVNAAVLAAALTFLMAGLWRGRRVGPLVVEPLPVIVPASEATKGRARLYRRGRSFGHAAAALRAGAARRLVQRLGLGPHATRGEIVAAAATSSHHDDAAVDALLYGPAPTSEAAMMDLVRRIDALESEVDPT